MIAAIGLLVGVLLGPVLQPDVPIWLEPYLPIAVVAALDAVFGALRAFLDGIFDDKVFVVSFVSNVLIAALIVYLGDKLGVGGSCRPASSSCSASGSSPTSPRSAGTSSMPEPRDAETRARAAPSDGRGRLVAALRRPGSRGQVDGRGAAGAAGLRRRHPGEGQPAGRPVRRRAAGRPDPVHQQPLARLPARGERDLPLQRTRDALRSDTRSRRTALERAQQQATTLGILAGTVPVVGPGVRVTVTDDKGGVGSNQLLEGLEELRDAGAEAIELNDKVRVVAQTSLKDTRGGSLVDGTLLKSPFVIEAIGNAPSLATALDFKGGFTDEVRAAQRRRHGRRGRGRRVRRREDLHRRGARDTAVHPAREDGIACRLHLRPTVRRRERRVPRGPEVHQ